MIGVWRACDGIAPRAGARVVESGTHGQGLVEEAWARLEQIPDPRSPQRLVYPLTCLLAIAVCAFTAAGHDRLTAVGQWVAKASQEDLARLRAPVDPLTRAYRAPSEKTIRQILARIDPGSLSRALLGSRKRRRRTPAGAPSKAVRDYQARRLSHAQVKARVGLRAVAVDGNTSRGARRGDGTRVHLLGVADHDGPLHRPGRSRCQEGL